MEGNVLSRGLSLILILLVTFVFTAEGGESDLFSKIRIDKFKGDKKAPDLSLRDLDGYKVDIRQLRGKMILLNFWATWRGPCKEEMSSLEALHQRFKERNFVLLAISVDYEDLKHVRDFMNKHHYTFPVLLDPKGETLDLFEVKGIPTTFLIDKTGRMIGKATGPRDWKSPEVFSLINLLIEK